jgi:CheY-like chemotaxis protein
MRPAKLLLVEQSNVDIVLFKMALGRWERSFQLTVANNGEQALNLLLRSEGPLIPDIIVMDLGFSREASLSLLETIREKNELKSIPVVVFSDSNQECSDSEAYKSKASACVRKPVDFEEFKAVVFGLQDLLKS